MKFRIPDGFNLGGLWWTVEKDSAIPAESSRYAETLYRIETIRLGKGYSAQRVQENFLHEVIHAVSECGSIGISEKQVTQLSYGLMSVLQQLEAEP